MLDHTLCLEWQIEILLPSFVDMILAIKNIFVSVCNIIRQAVVRKHYVS